MPYVNKPRPYKKEYKQQLERGEHERRNERARARYKWDKENGKASRKGKDIAHVKALSKGGKNGDGVKLQHPSKNRSFKRNPDRSMK